MNIEEHERSAEILVNGAPAPRFVAWWPGHVSAFNPRQWFATIGGRPFALVPGAHPDFITIDVGGFVCSCFELDGFPWAPKQGNRHARRAAAAVTRRLPRIECRGVPGLSCVLTFYPGGH